jgi:hypothetical protein
MLEVSLPYLAVIPKGRKKFNAASRSAPPRRGPPPVRARGIGTAKREVAGERRDMEWSVMRREDVVARREKKRSERVRTIDGDDTLGPAARKPWTSRKSESVLAPARQWPAASRVSTDGVLGLKAQKSKHRRWQLSKKKHGHCSW